MGELHLEVLVDRMLREYKVDANVGRPQVSYRETIRGTAEKVEGRFVRQTGGSGQYGIVYIDVEPAPGEGFDFVNKIKGGSIPTEFIPAVEKGVEEAMENGPRAGYPMVDVRVTLTDGKYHDTDSSEIAFKVAGSLALKAAVAARQAGAARADLRGRGRDARGVHGRRDRRPQPSARPRQRDGAARQRAGQSPRTCRWRRCSATRPTCAQTRRVGRRTRCSSTATTRCRRTSPRSSAAGSSKPRSLGAPQVAAATEILYPE